MKEKFSGLRPESALVALQYTTYRLTRAIFFFKKQTENEAGRPVLDLFLFLKGLHKVKASGQHRSGHTIKTNCITFPTFDPEICSILIFL